LGSILRRIGDAGDEIAPEVAEQFLRFFTVGVAHFIVEKGSTAELDLIRRGD